MKRWIATLLLSIILVPLTSRAEDQSLIRNAEGVSAMSAIGSGLTFLSSHVLEHESPRSSRIIRGASRAGLVGSLLLLVTSVAADSFENDLSPCRREQAKQKIPELRSVFEAMDLANDPESTPASALAISN